jgi:hypothetical protein
LWYTFEGTGGDITISTTGDFDHELSINSGEPGSLDNLDCQDGFGTTETYTVQSSLEGETYYVYVAHWSSFSSTTGDLNISIDCAEPPACDAPTLVLSPSTADTCLDATETYMVELSFDGGSGNDSYAVIVDGDTTNVDADGSEEFGPFTPGIAVEFLAIGNDDDACSTTGSIGIPFCPPTNDECAGAIALECNSTVVGGTILANPDSSECGGSSGGNGVWYTYTSPADQIVTLETCLDGTDFDSDLSVFTGSCDALTCFGGFSGDGYTDGTDIDGVSCGGGFPLSFRAGDEFMAQAGVTYTILLSGYGSGDEGNFELAVSCEEVNTQPLNITMNWNGGCYTRDAVITLCEPGTDNALSTYEVVVTNTGSFTLPIEMGTYDLLIKVEGHLQKGIPNVEISEEGGQVDMGSFINGDINGDNYINILDASVLNGSYGLTTGSASFNTTADLNCDGMVNILDASILNANYGTGGDVAPLTE